MTEEAKERSRLKYWAQCPRLKYTKKKRKASGLGTPNLRTGHEGKGGRRRGGKGRERRGAKNYIIQCGEGEEP